MKPSQQPLYASGHDGCFPFADEEEEAQRLNDLLKITVLIRSLSGSGAHALDLQTSLPLPNRVQAVPWPRLWTEWNNNALLPTASILALLQHLSVTKMTLTGP